MRQNKICLWTLWESELASKLVGSKAICLGVWDNMLQLNPTSCRHCLQEDFGPAVTVGVVAIQDN